MQGDLTHDAFLGGRLFLWQPRAGYRAGVDPVLLAAAVPATPGQRVLDLGCGAGAAVLCLGTRVANLDLTGVELQPLYADLARRNADEAGIGANIVTADLRDLPGDLRQRQFDHIMANPPYFQSTERRAAQDDGREIALAGDTALGDWIERAARRLAPKGYLHMIQRVERLPEMLAATEGRLGSVEVLPIAARSGRAPGLVILRARKEGRAPFRLSAPFVMHDGARHLSDAEDYNAATLAILRQGAALSW
ncbi:MAG: methyltransferase [Marinibacterium sp.]|nr:methyltransferase [Marinibacterium sp.]